MGKAPAFQFYAGDFLTDVMDWTDEEVGVHVRLLAWSWVNRRGIPRDTQRLTRIAPKAAEAWRVVGEKWSDGPDDTWINEKLESTRADNDAFRASQRERSLLAVAARQGKDKPKGQPNDKPMGSPMGDPVEGEDNTLRGKERAKQSDEGFDEFYAPYPNKKAKGAAERAWAKLTKDERALCKPAIEAQVKAHHFRGTDGNDYVPHPATWLNEKRWQDEIKEPKPVMVHGAPKLMSKAEALKIIAQLREKHGRDFQTHHIPADVYAAYKQQA